MCLLFNCFSFSTCAACLPPVHPQTNWLLMWDCKKIPQVVVKEIYAVLMSISTSVRWVLQLKLCCTGAHKLSQQMKMQISPDNNESISRGEKKDGQDQNRFFFFYKIKLYTCQWYRNKDLKGKFLVLTPPFRCYLSCITRASVVSFYLLLNSNKLSKDTLVKRIMSS